MSDCCVENLKEHIENRCGEVRQEAEVVQPREDADDGDEKADGLKSCFGSMIMENWPKEGKISF